MSYYDKTLHEFTPHDALEYERLHMGGECKLRWGHQFESLSPSRTVTFIVYEVRSVEPVEDLGHMVTLRTAQFVGNVPMAGAIVESWFVKEGSE